MSYQPEPKPGAYSPPNYGAQPYASPQGDPQQLAAMQYRNDSEVLQMLSILHYVMAGFAALGSCVSLLYLVIGLSLVGGSTVADKADESAGLAIAGGFFSVVALFIFAIIFAQAVALFLCGRWLASGHNRIFCFIVACLICTSFPFGTALGIFTIVILSRPSVIARFEANRAGYFQPPQKAY